MKCEACVRDGKRSTVHELSSITTSLQSNYFFDEDGEHHFHNPNVTTSSWRCSNGHEFVREGRSECETCKRAKLRALPEEGK